MKTIKEINKEIERDNEGKTAVDALMHKISVYESYYELAILKIVELENKLKQIKSKK